MHLTMCSVYAAWAARVTCSAASSIIQQARLPDIDVFYLYRLVAHELLLWRERNEKVRAKGQGGETDGESIEDGCKGMEDWYV